MMGLSLWPARLEWNARRRIPQRRQTGEDSAMFHRVQWLGCTAALLVLALAVRTAEAQDVTDSLDQLRGLVKVGDQVIATDVHGREMQGSVAEVSASSLGLVMAGHRIDLSLADLDTVSRRDSRLNGTFLGLAIGAGLGALFEKSLADEYGREDVGYGSAVLPIAGMGAGIGFVVDAMIRGRRMIYRKASGTTTNVMISPVWSSHRQSIVVTLRF